MRIVRSKPDRHLLDILRFVWQPSIGDAFLKRADCDCVRGLLEVCAVLREVFDRSLFVIGFDFQSTSTSTGVVIR